MTALRRMTVWISAGPVALIALGLATPALGQNSDAPVDVTAAPPPSAETVGPAQLRDFSLQGTVTRPADTSAVTPARPSTTAPAAPRPGEAVPADAAVPTAGDASQGQPSAVRVTRAAPTGQESRAAPIADPSTAPVTPSQPLTGTTSPAPQPAIDDSSLAAGAADPASGFFTWPWLAALIALVAGGAFLVWSRRNRRLRYDDPGRMAFAGPTPDIEPEAKPLPPVRPRADPVPPRAQPEPRPDPVPPRAPAPAPRPADDGLIVSTRFKPELNVQFVPDRVVVTPTDAVLQFDIVIANAGSAPARDVLVEAKMFCAHPGQDGEIATFFQQPAGTGDRIPQIAPLGRLSLKSAVRMPIDQLRSFEAQGRKLFVPLVGFNVLFRSGSGEGQASASFLVGRGNERDEKLAPFRLDLGPRIFRGLSARPHSLGLQPA